MNIPKCLNLDPKIKEAIYKWGKTFPLLEDYEDVTCSSSFTFHVYTDGLGDNLSVTSRGRTIYVGIDDDGELYAEEK